VRKIVYRKLSFVAPTRRYIHMDMETSPLSQYIINGKYFAQWNGVRSYLKPSPLASPTPHEPSIKFAPIVILLICYKFHTHSHSYHFMHFY